MKSSLLLVCLMASFLSPTCHAGFVSGNKLLADLSENNEFGEAYGFGYLIGVFDANEGITHCVEFDGVTQGQIKQAAIEYLEAHAEDLHRPADWLLKRAFRESSPCPER